MLAMARSVCHGCSGQHHELGSRNRFSTQAAAPAFTICIKYCWFSCMV